LKLVRRLTDARERSTFIWELRDSYKEGGGRRGKGERGAKGAKTIAK